MEILIRVEQISKFFFFEKNVCSTGSTTQQTNISTEILIIRVERKKTNFRKKNFDYPIEPDAMLLGSFHDLVFLPRSVDEKQNWDARWHCSMGNDLRIKHKKINDSSFQGLMLQIVFSLKYPHI